ncbi:MAG TPA: DUF2141 domain-containing protein [Bacteroidales bacterium]|nr:DUF2141 domain-containing protein [Bacteroidales bacterium]
MVKLSLIILSCLLMGFSNGSQITLTILIKNLDSNAGSVVLDFRDGNDKPVKGFSGTIVNKQSCIRVAGLRPGKYAFRYFHDRNNNKKMDTNRIGIPTEGYGFSNNAKGRFGPPVFKDMVFEVTKDATVISTPVYF